MVCTFPSLFCYECSQMRQISRHSTLQLFLCSTTALPPCRFSQTPRPSLLAYPYPRIQEIAPEINNTAASHITVQRGPSAVNVNCTNNSRNALEECERVVAVLPCVLTYPFKVRWVTLQNPTNLKHNFLRKFECTLTYSHV